MQICVIDSEERRAYSRDPRLNEKSFSNMTELSPQENLNWHFVPLKFQIPSVQCDGNVIHCNEFTQNRIKD
jgi:hypothetical protein